MKFFAVLLLAANSTFAATFTTGQAARLVIGQKTFTEQAEGASDTVLGGVGGVAYGGDMLVVSDANRVAAEPINHRVLIYKGLSSMLPKPTDPLEYTQRCPVCVGKASLVLGQPNFEETAYSTPPSATTLRTPTGVATDGRILAVADTDNNRVLIWLSIPSNNQAPADVVLGQPDFKTVAVVNPPTASSLRGPQGVWIQDGRLFVADTFNNRVLIWNSIPTTNGKAADVVIGQKDFNVAVQIDLTQTTLNPKADTLLSPVSVTSDGQRMYVADLGHNRVLIWNSIPTTNGQPADVVLGQPDMTSAVANNSSKLCASTGTDKDGNPTYPALCGATMDFPRFALSDGKWLFVADGGNDRILVYYSVPTQNGTPADVVLGQPKDTLNLGSDAAYQWRVASADSLRTPTSLAWDGLNLFIADSFNRRVMVFTLAEPNLPYTAVRNAASRFIYATGSVTFSGSMQLNDEVTIKIGEKEYKYKITDTDTLETVTQKFVDLINEGDGDPLVYALPNLNIATVILTAREAGEAGDSITLSASVAAASSDKNPMIAVTTSGANLSGGKDAAKIAPGSLVTILGENLSEFTAAAPADANPLPRELAGVEVYFDGIKAPLLFVSPTQINAQLPFDVSDSTSVNAFVRVRWSDGRVTVTNPVAVPVVGENPGIFAFDGVEPRRAVAYHYSDRATGTVSIDGTAAAGDVCTITIEDRTYTYVVQAGDTLTSIRDAFVRMINQDPKVEAFPSSIWTRVRLRARVPGPEGNNIKFSANVPEGSSVVMTAFNQTLCCANEAGSLVTEDNPAMPGETIVIFATGLGLIKPEQANAMVRTGYTYEGPAFNEPREFVSSMAGGKTANVLACGMKPGAIGIYEVHLELNSAQPTNPMTQLTISQSDKVSNIVTIPVYNPTETD